MRKPTIFASATLLLLGTVGALTVTAAQSQDDSTAKQDIKDAGHETKKAAKKTGSATKKTAKKATHKTAEKTDEGAQKVEDKTKPN
jgi:ribulose kinase